MDLRRAEVYGPVAVLAGVVVLISFLTGCQATQSVSAYRLIAHQAMIDFSGLAPPQTLTQLEVAASIPQRWEKMRTEANPLYVHQQWRSPSHCTGVGVAYIHLPLPMGARAIVWLAKMQYAKQGDSSGQTAGKLVDEWTDAIGREWFEAENAKYHVRGYAVTSGFDAWIVYSGYRLKDALNPIEMGMAARSMDTILPLPIANSQNNPATANAAR